MNFESLLLLGQTALENGLVISLCVLALYLSYRMLGVCDLSTDGCFTLGDDFFSESAGILQDSEHYFNL